MSEPAEILTVLGLVLLLGLATDAVGRYTGLPRVTLLVAFGFLIGPAGLGMLPAESEAWFPLFANLALVMVGFLLGEKFRLSSLRRHGRAVMWISITAVLATALTVGGGLALFGFPVEQSLLLGAIATATAPAATAEVVRQYHGRGSFSRTLLGVVAVDDAWGLITFSLALAAVVALTGEGSAVEIAVGGLWDIGGAVLLGVLLGLPAAGLSGRIERGEPTLIEALGVVLLCGGLALWLEVSFLLSAMVLGAVVANFAKHHTRPFHAIEGIEWPFMIMFFMLAGASLQWRFLLEIGWLGLAYVLLRVAGRLMGAWAGARFAGSGQTLRRWMGVALLPQAGVALGMALVACEHSPALQESLLPVVIGSTVIFELIGPICTRWALFQTGEAQLPRQNAACRHPRLDDAAIMRKQMAPVEHRRTKPAHLSPSKVKSDRNE